MNALTAALCLTLVWFLGSLLSTVLRAGSLSPSRSSFGWPFLLGAASVGLALHLPLVVDGRITHLSFALVAIAGALACGWRLRVWWRDRRVASSPRLSFRSSFGWLSNLPLSDKILAAVLLLFALHHAFTANITVGFKLSGKLHDDDYLTNSESTTAHS